MKKVGLCLACCLVAVFIITSPSCRADALTDLGNTQSECYLLKLQVEASIFRTDGYKATCQEKIVEVRNLCAGIDPGDERFFDAQNALLSVEANWNQANLWYDLGTTDKSAADADLLKSEDITNGRTVGDRLADALTALEHYQAASSRFELGAEDEFDHLRDEIAALKSLVQ